MARKRARDFERQLKEMRKHRDDPVVRDLRHNQPLQKISSQVDSIEPHFGILINATYALASWEGVVGCLAVLDGDPDGWRTLRRACRLGGWSIRLVFGMLDRGSYRAMGRLPINFDQIARTLAFAIAVGVDDLADWCGGRVHDQLRANRAVFDEWDLGPLGPFLVELYCRWRGREFLLSDYSKKDLGIYRGIFDRWDDPEGLAGAIAEVCDYHKAESLPDPSGFPQFEAYPYPIFPAEVLALRRVRADLGLTTPEVADPLLDSPLGQPPDAAPASTEDDPLIDRIRFAALMALPKIGDPW